MLDSKQMPLKIYGGIVLGIALSFNFGVLIVSLLVVIGCLISMLHSARVQAVEELRSFRASIEITELEQLWEWS